MSTLKYDSSTKSWISPNGTLTLKGDVSYDDLNVYGAVERQGMDNRKRKPFFPP